MRLDPAAVFLSRSRCDSCDELAVVCEHLDNVVNFVWHVIDVYDMPDNVWYTACHVSPVCPMLIDGYALFSV